MSHEITSVYTRALHGKTIFLMKLKIKYFIIHMLNYFKFNVKF